VYLRKKWDKNIWQIRNLIPDLSNSLSLQNGSKSRFAKTKTIGH
jgi:hypothetical protein